MTYEQFQNQVETMIANLTAIKIAPAAGWAFKYQDYPLAVCECAAEIGGFDVTFAKMFNRQFRDDACNMMFDRALAVVA